MGQFGQITHTQTYVVPFHTRKIFTTLRVNSPSFSGRIVPLFDSMLVPQGAGSGTPTEPHHTPTPEATPSPQHELSSSSLPPVTTESLSSVIPSDNPPLRQYTRRTRIAQSSDRANIAKTSTLPSDSTPRVTSLAADEGKLEINRLKAKIKLLEDKDRGVAEHSGDDAPIKGRSLDEREETDERVSDDTEEVATVLTSMDAVSILTSGGVQVVPTTAEVATATVIYPIHKKKGKEKMVESDTPKKKKLQEQIDVQVARELEEQMAREDQRMSEQIARDAEVARIHAEEELQMMINSLDRSNETVVKYLQEYEHIPEDLSIEEMIELISDLIEDFIPMGSKEEAERFKRKGLRLEQESAKKLKTSKEVPKEVKSTEEVPEEKVKEMMQLVPIKEVYVEALQVKTLLLTGRDGDLGGAERLYEPDVEDQLWTHTQNLMHAPIKWKLYDTCGVHHVTYKDKEIFILVEKDYPLRKGLAIEMISYKLQVENYSQMATDLILKIYKIASTPTASEDFPLPEQLSTANEDKFPLLIQSGATADELCAAAKVKE
nr:hypothetical protein [Tanacetum cinerariifolium]